MGFVCNSSSGEAKLQGLRSYQSQPRLHCVRPSQKIKRKKKRKEKNPQVLHCVITLKLIFILRMVYPYIEQLPSSLTSLLILSMKCLQIEQGHQTHTQNQQGLI